MGILNAAYNKFIKQQCSNCLTGNTYTGLNLHLYSHTGIEFLITIKYFRIFVLSNKKIVEIYNNIDDNSFFKYKLDAKMLYKSTRLLYKHKI